MKLAVISHTEHYISPDGQIVGWGPTIRELNHLTTIFEEIWHVAVLHDGTAPPSSIPYSSEKIHFVALKPFGGERLKDKFGILFKAPSIIATVAKTLKKVDCWQFRAPTGIGVFLIPYLVGFVTKPGWFKYAGNWMHQNPPLGYWWQRFWLENLQKRKVTINGTWPRQLAHCLTFENPCLTEEELQDGLQVLLSKNYAPPFSLCFVGRLEDSKGVDIILEFLKHLPPELLKEVHLVGDGVKRAEYESLATAMPHKFIFHGFLPLASIIDIYKISHFFIFPSKGEGFPKVIAEAMNYGCIPIVSDISSIPQYIKNKKNGFLISNENIKNIESFFSSDTIPFYFPEDQLCIIAKEGQKTTKIFTFSYYINRIRKEILNDY